MTSCLLSWMTNPLRKRPTLKRKNLLLRDQILFFYELTPEMGSKNENKRVASPESVSIQCNIQMVSHDVIDDY